MSDIRQLAKEHGKCGEWVDPEQTIVCLRPFPHDGYCGLGEYGNMPNDRLMTVDRVNGQQGLPQLQSDWIDWVMTGVTFIGLFVIFYYGLTR